MSVFAQYVSGVFASTFLWAAGIWSMSDNAQGIPNLRALAFAAPGILCVAVIGLALVVLTLGFIAAIVNALEER